MAEEIIFGNKFDIVGDKFGFYAKDIDVARRPLINIPMKIIHIIRDGRDSVSSGIRKSKGVSRDKWNTTDPYKGSLNWAQCLEQWFTIVKDLDESSFITLKFEDLIFNPKEKLKMLADFIGVGHNFTKKFGTASAHIGRHKRDITDWEATFAPAAIEMLKKLEYIA